MDDTTTSAGFNDAVLPLQPALMRVALRLTRNTSEARDLVQDALERALREWARFTPGTNARAWVTAILSRRFIDAWRRRRRQPRFVGIDNIQLPDSHDRMGDARPAPSWEDVTDADLEWAIAALPAPLRRVFELNMIDELSYLEISTALEIPINTVGTRLLRARRRLRALLQRRIGTQVSFRVNAPEVPDCVRALGKSAEQTVPPQRRARGQAQSASRSIKPRASTAHGAALESRPM